MSDDSIAARFDQWITDWSPPYTITFDGEMWTAQYHGQGTKLIAYSAANLRLLMLADRQRRQP